MTVTEIRPHRGAFEAAGVDACVFGKGSGNRLRTEPRLLSLWRNSRSGFERRGHTHPSI
jgi:hypothetical protein